jgi:hypothetical protein
MATRMSKTILCTLAVHNLLVITLGDRLIEEASYILTFVKDIMHLDSTKLTHYYSNREIN